MFIGHVLCDVSIIHFYNISRWALLMLNVSVMVGYLGRRWFLASITQSA
jgi:hypothetical protein